MAKVDITGLLTGLAGTPDLEREGIKRASAIQGGGLGSNLARSLALQAPQREQMMRQGAGGLFGVDTRTTGQQIQEQLGQLDISTPSGQQQAVQLVAQIDPTRALALRTRFAEENKALAARKAQKTASKANRESIANQLDPKKYASLIKAVMNEEGTGRTNALDQALKIAGQQGTVAGKADTSIIEIVDATGKPVKVLVDNSDGTVIKTYDAENKETDKDLNTSFQEIMVAGNPVKALINENTGVILKTYGIPTDASGITNEMKTFNAVVAANKAAGIDTPTFPNWRKGEIAEKNMSPKRREYAELKAEAVNAGSADFPSYGDWHNTQGLATLIDKRIDTATGIETSYLINKKNGKIVQKLGVTAMPVLSIEKNDDGTYSVYNQTTGVMGDSVETEASAAIKQQKFYATMSAINAIDGTMGALSEAQRLKGDGPDGESVGGFEYALLSFVPESDARLLKSKVKTIQANLAFDKLQNMRDNSPTGGALGQVSNLELDLLKSAIEALDPKLGVEAFNGQVVRIAEHYNRFKQSLLEQSDYVVDPKTKDIFITSPEGKIYRVGTQAQRVL